MGQYLGSWKIDDILYVTKQTSSVTTGAATDADALPTWRVYEDNTATPVTTGSFATLNAQTGFYVAALTLASAIGYEKGRSYSVRSQATVAAIIGADVDTFQIEAEVDANNVSTPVALTAGAITAGTITDGALTSPKFAAGFITAGSITAGALQGFTLGSVAGAVGSVTAAVTVGATSQAAIADAVWDETGADHVSAGSFGARLNVSVNSMTAGAIGPVSLTAGAITAGVITDGALTSPKFAAGFITAGSITDGALTAAKFGAGFITAGSFSGNALAGMAVTVGATAQAAIADAVWDEAKAGHTTADTYGEYLDSTTSAIKTDTAAVLADTDQLQLGIIYGAAAAGTLSTTQATSNLTGYTDDQLIGRVIIVTSGVAEGEASDITDYAEAAGLLTFTAMTLAMGAGDTFKIV